MNSSYSEETCSPLQLHPPPWKSRFSGPANLAQAVWMEVLWVSLPEKYLWNASPGSDFIGMTELGQGQKKKSFPARPCCFSYPGAGVCYTQNLSGPSLEVLGYFPEANIQIRKCCNPYQKRI